jgi:hypothetical protein
VKFERLSEKKEAIATWVGEQNARYVAAHVLLESIMSTSTRPIAVLKLSRSVKQVSAFAKSVATALTGNAALPTPTPSVATLEADIAALDSAEAAVLTRTKGAAEIRNEKLAALRADLVHILAYVQAVADASPGTAESIIQGAGMSVKQVGSRTKGEIVAEQGSVSGSAKVTAKAAARRAGYEWQYSVDQKTWTNAPFTLEAKTEIAGLTPATTYYFRVRPVTKDGEGDWSQVASLIVK